MDGRIFLVEFPAAEQKALRWWLVDAGQITGRGCDHDPLPAAGISFVAGDAAAMPRAISGYTQIALLASSVSVVRWHELDSNFTEKQTLAAAMIEARNHSLDGDALHFAACSDIDGRIITASAGKALLTGGLARLKTLNINPDIVTPSGLLIRADQGDVVQADLGFDRLLRAKRLIAPAEQALIENFAGEGGVNILENSEVDGALIAANARPLLNFCVGLFAKKARTAVTSRQKRSLIGLFAGLLLISLAIPIVEWIKYASAAKAADSAALAAAETQLGKFPNLEAAEQQLDARLIKESRGNLLYSAPSSALFAAVQAAPAVNIDQMSYRQDGTLSVRLSANRKEEINPVLLAVQQNGFRLVVKPATDATGMAKADIIVRAP